MKKTTSAGGVVLNEKNEVLVVNQNGNSWSLPKGHVDGGEEPLAAARREIFEEAGVKELRFVRELGRYERSRIGPGGRGEDSSEMKTMIFFLFRTNQEKLAPQDTHHPEARWVSIEQVAALLTHPQDKNFFRRIAPTLSS